MIQIMSRIYLKFYQHVNNFTYFFIIYDILVKFII